MGNWWSNNSLMWYMGRIDQLANAYLTMRPIIKSTVSMGRYLIMGSLFSNNYLCIPKYIVCIDSRKKCGWRRILIPIKKGPFQTMPHTVLNMGPFISLSCPIDRKCTEWQQRQRGWVSTIIRKYLQFYQIRYSKNHIKLPQTKISFNSSIGFIWKIKDF